MTTTDKRRTILKALEKVLKDQRYDEVTVDEVAEAAGVGKGTVYRYFEDKEDLFFQMIQEFLSEESDAVSVVAAAAMPPREKLVRIGETISKHIQLHGRYIRMMHAQHNSQRQGRDPHETMRNHHQRLDRILAQVLRDAESTGLLRPNLDYEAVLCLYKGMIMESSMCLLHMDTTVSLEQLVDLILAGVGQPN